MKKVAKICAALAVCSFTHIIHSKGLFSDIRERINEEFDRVEQLMESEFETLKHRSILQEQKQVSLDTYKPQEQWSEDKSTLTIAISLPGFNKKDISVTISETLENDTVTKRMLDIQAKGKTITQKHSVTSQNGRKIQTYAMQHSAMKHAFVTDDKRTQTISYKDGSVNLNLQLPEDINTQDYEMSFDEAMLKLTFKAKK